MEKEDYKFKVTNLKISVKLPQAVSLKFVDDRCKLLQPIHTGIYCKKYGKNILTVRYKNFTYILFKKSSKGVTRLQHHENKKRIRHSRSDWAPIFSCQSITDLGKLHYRQLQLHCQHQSRN